VSRPRLGCRRLFTLSAAARCSCEHGDRHDAEHIPHRVHVLRLSRPRDKCLAGTLQPSSAKKLGQGEGGIPLPFAGQERERREYRLRFLEIDLRLPAETAVPPNCGPSEPLRLLVGEQQAELEGFS
jgi:hypothetical protein